jgi:hypothetical protein
MSESTTYLAVHEDDQRVVVTTDQLASVCRDPNSWLSYLGMLMGNIPARMRIPRKNGNIDHEIIKVVPDLPDYRETSYRDLG